jgi:hypothetical protein
LTLREPRGDFRRRGRFRRRSPDYLADRRLPDRALAARTVQATTQAGMMMMARTVATIIVGLLIAAAITTVLRLRVTAAVP